MRTHARVAATLALAATAACADAPAARTVATFDTLPNGAVHVTNEAAGLWEPGEAWTLVEDLRLGTIEGEGPESFSGIWVYEVDADGRILVGDRDSREVRVFAPDGGHLFTLGGAGEGPEELSGVDAIRVDRAGRIRVVDNRNSRYTTWSATGDFIDTRRRFSSAQISPWPGAFLDDGRVVEVEFGTPSHVLFDAEGDPLGPVPTPAFDAPRLTVDAGGGGTASYPVPYAPGLVLHFESDGTFWSGISSDYRVVEHDLLTGDTLRVVDRAYTPDPVRSVEVDAMLESYRNVVPDIDADDVPDIHPAYIDFQTDDAGYLWVQRTPPPPADVTIDDISSPRPPLFDIFDDRGRYLGEVPSPIPLHRPKATNTHLYGIARDDFGVQYLVRFRTLGR